MEPSKLPVPLNLLQAAKISEISSLKLIFPVLAQAIGAKTHNIDFTDFVDSVKEFELNYTFWDECNKYFSKINTYNPKLLEAIKSGNNIKIDLTESDINLFQSWMNEFFTKNDILAIERTGNSAITTMGMFFECFIMLGSKLSNIVNNPKFKF